MACQGQPCTPAVLAAAAVLCLDASCPLPTALHMLALLGQQAGSCPAGPFLGLLTALSRGPPGLATGQAHDEAGWERHLVVAQAACRVLLGVADTGAADLLSPVYAVGDPACILDRVLAAGCTPSGTRAHLGCSALTHQNELHLPARI